LNSQVEEENLTEDERIEREAEKKK
jgi:hypothetical protein